MKRSVAGITLEASRALVARRVSGGSLSEKWEFPGGKVEPGETDEEALVREYREEFAVPVRVGKKLADTSFEHKGCTVRLSAYQVFLESRNLVLREHTDWRWACLREIERLDFADSDLKLLPSLRAQALISED